MNMNCVLAYKNGAFGVDFWGPEEDGSMTYPCSGPARGEIPVSRGTVSRAKAATPAHRRIKTAAQMAASIYRWPHRFIDRRIYL